jgi:2-phosphosulfolactate phosphatase
MAHRVVVGAFLNLSAVVASLENEPRVEILCAGTGGEETREDILAAGAMMSQLAESSKHELETNDAADAARSQWAKVVAAANVAARPLQQQLALELRDTQGGRNLLGIGLDQDLVDCAQIDRLHVVPVFNVSERRIHLS